MKVGRLRTESATLQVLQAIVVSAFARQPDVHPILDARRNFECYAAVRLHSTLSMTLLTTRREILAFPTACLASLVTQHDEFFLAALGSFFRCDRQFKVEIGARLSFVLHDPSFVDGSRKRDLVFIQLIH